MRELLIENMKRAIELLENDNVIYKNIEYKIGNTECLGRNKNNTELLQRLKEIRRDSLLFEKNEIKCYE